MVDSGWATHSVHMKSSFWIILNLQVRQNKKVLLRAERDVTTASQSKGLHFVPGSYTSSGPVPLAHSNPDAPLLKTNKATLGRQLFTNTLHASWWNETCWGTERVRLDFWRDCLGCAQRSDAGRRKPQEKRCVWCGPEDIGQECWEMQSWFSN